MMTSTRLTTLLFASSLLGCAAAPDPSGDVEIERVVLHHAQLEFDARAAGPEDGELVLLLHGFPTTSYAFEPQLRALGAAGYRAVAPDLRGYSPGARPSGVESYALPELAGDVVAIADELGAARFHLVGHDWGAAIGWVTSGIHADRVQSFTAISIPHPAALQAAMLTPQTGQPQASTYAGFLRSEGAAQRLLADDAGLLRALYGEPSRGLETEAFGDVDLTRGGRVPAANVTEYLKIVGDELALSRALDYYHANWGALEDPGTSLDWLVISSPTLYLWGEQDFSVTPAAAGASGELVDAPYEFVPLANMGHWIPELAADRLTEALLTHVGSHGSQSQ